MSRIATTPEPGIILHRMGETESTGPISVVAPISVEGKETLVIGRQDWSEDLGIVHFSPSGSVDMLQQTLEENLFYRQQIVTLAAEIADVRAELRAFLQGTLPSPRKVTKTQGKREITNYFDEHDGETVFPSDVSAALNLDYGLVLDLIEQLESEGQVAKAEA